MSEQYSKELLRVAVAQICQTIGYNATQTSSIELLQDLLHRFLQEFARDLHLQVEHDNRTRPCLEDVALTFSSLNLNLHELLDYIGNVEPVPFALDIPKFPVNKPSNLNFLKPGSKEVLSRPVHIFEHLPPMLPPDMQSSFGNENKAQVAFGIAAAAVEENQTPNSTTTPLMDDKKLLSAASFNPINKVKTEIENDRVKLDLVINGSSNSCSLAPVMIGKPPSQANDLGRPTREIMSVVMTTGGFISPAIEGKLPEPGIPSLVDKYFGLDAPPPPTPPPPPPPEVIPKIDAPPIKSEKTSDTSKAKSTNNNKDTAAVSSAAMKKTVMPRGDIVNNMIRNPEAKSSPQKQNTKKFPFLHQSNATTQQHAQPHAAKLLKKAKKKNLGLNATALHHEDATMTGHIDEILMQNPEKLSDKARRKRLKTLQKMLKNVQKHQSGIDLKKETKKMKALLNSNNLMNEIPADRIERVRLEKMLKKQAKQKQKQLKKQLSLESQKNAADFPASLLSKGRCSGGGGGEQIALDTAAAAAVAPSMMDCALPGVDVNIYDPKQTTNTTKPLLPNYEKDSILSSNSTLHSTQIGPYASSTSSFVDEQNKMAASQPPEKLNALEIKLSNEPDRNKLNIFKKISKTQQKGGAAQQQLTQQQLPTKQPPIATSNSFTGSEGQIINLPSGTTITPAPSLEFNAPCRPLPQKNNSQEGVFDVTSSQCGAFDLSTTTTTTTTEPEPPINKPKKRGRKPGSKNQPKPLLPPFNALNPAEQIPNAAALKKQKKKQTAAAAANAAKLDLLVQDSLSQYHPTAKILPPQVQSPNDPSQIFATQQAFLKAQRKERKEKEKPKTSGMLPPAPGTGAHTLLDKDIVVGGGGGEGNKMENIGIPMNLSGSQFGGPLNMFFNNNMEQNLTMQQQQQQSKPRKRPYNQTKNQPPPPIPNPSSAAAMLPNFLKGTHQTPASFRNLSSNMLSMLPFPFPPRPGLIPSPGLFPPTGGMPNFSNQMPNVATATATATGGNAPNLLGMGPPFFPFSPIKPQTAIPAASAAAAAHQMQDHTTARDRLKDIPAGHPFSKDRSYCNVAPLVPPEAIQQVTGTGIAESYHPSPSAMKHQSSLNDLCNKNTRGAPPLQHDVAANSLLQNVLATMATQSADNSVKAAANEKHHLPTGSLDDPIEVSDDSDELTTTAQIHTAAAARGNLGSAVVAPPSQYLNTPPILPHKSTAIDGISSVIIPNASDKKDPNVHLKLNLQDSESTTNLIAAIEPKKLKKLQKQLKKNSKMDESAADMSNLKAAFGGNGTAAASTSSNSARDGGGGGFGKLAGGADLIPLTGTGLSYSARSIPPTSLTACSKQLNAPTYEPPTPHHSLRQYSGGEPVENLFNDVSIIPSIQKKKSKEHKKLRKMKELESKDGKIKKKKDKKDKTKDKELVKFALGQEVVNLEKHIGGGGAGGAGGGDKDALKRLKKEKKKLKQRLLANHPHEPCETPVVLSSNINSNAKVSSSNSSLNEAVQAQAQETSPSIKNIPLSSSTVSSEMSVSASAAVAPESTTAVATSIIPKLTLKIQGNSSSSPTPPVSVSTKKDERDVARRSTTPKRDPSPELARFSPLVTRPPKQKISQNDNQPTYFANSTTSSDNKSNVSVKPTESILATPSPQVIPPPSPWLTGGTLTASSVLLPQQLTTTSSFTTTKPTKLEERSHQHPPPASKSDISSNTAPHRSSTNAATNSNEQNAMSFITETNRPSSYVDAEGNTVWICPACGKVDDGSPMIGCDGCDAWYHWECVGISVAPNDNEDWFCRVCITRRKGFHGGLDGNEKKRKRNKKK